MPRVLGGERLITAGFGTSRVGPAPLGAQFFLATTLLGYTFPTLTYGTTSLVLTQWADTSFYLLQAWP